MDDKTRRKLRNDELLHKFKTGESITHTTSQETWFPPRPIIKKDRKEMERIYEKEEGGVLTLEMVEAGFEKIRDEPPRRDVELVSLKEYRKRKAEAERQNTDG